MVKCPVCGTENSDLDTVCQSCKGFIQTKVDTLDLFSTCWGLIETPERTFRRIALAKTKNYVTLLSVLLGVALAYTYIWHWQLAAQQISLPLLLLFGALAGLALGNVLTVLLAFISRIVLRIGGTDLALRNTRAIVAYAGMPVAASLLMVFPAELAVFGQYFFDNNPPPLVLNPPAYIALIGLNALAALWSLILLVLGVRSACRTSWFRSVLVALAVGGSILAFITCLQLV